MSDPALNDWIEQLIADTRAGQIPWRLVNPTTYTWDTPQPRPARVVIQRVERTENIVLGAGRTQRKVTSSFVLQAFDLAKNQTMPLVTLNGAEDSPANEILKKLHTEVVNWTTRASIEFLNSLLPKLPVTGT